MTSKTLFGSLCLIGALESAATSPAIAADDLSTAARQLAADATRAGRNVVEGRDGWLFFAPELRHLGTAGARMDEPVAAMADFAGQLKAAGIELLVAPVPPKALVYPEHLPGSPAAPRAGEDSYTRLVAALDKAGVATLDLRAVFAKEKRTGAPLYCLKDTHWSGRGLEVAARAIAARAKSQPWYADGALTKTKLTTDARSVDITGDLARALTASAPPKESVALTMVGKPAGQSLSPLAPDRNSPLVLLGDSHNLVFHAGGDLFASGAGLPDQLAHALGIAVDVVAVRGAGAMASRVNLARRARADAAYLGRKKLVVWVFAARELTESTPWQKVPVVAASPAR